MQTDIFGLSVGIIGIVLGLITSYYFYKKSLRIKQPCWAIRSYPLIRDFSSHLSDLAILYKNKNAENLTVSLILFWNDGEDTIDKTDIATVNPLRLIPIENNTILDVVILENNSLSSQISINLANDGNYADIYFDYLDKKQGAVFQVVHTGTTSKDLNIVGDIKGVKQIQRKFTAPKWIQLLTNPPSEKMRRLQKPMSLFISIIAIALIVLGFYYLLNPEFPYLFEVIYSSDFLQSNMWKIFYGIFVIIFGILTFYIGSSAFKYYGNPPPGLSTFMYEWSNYYDENKM